MDVRKQGHRVKIVLSRCHPDFVRELFEKEIPEIQDRTIEIKQVAREAGYRSKVAVSSIDMKVDCVGACVGVRGSRIKNVIDEINGERIDIVRWNDSMQVMIRMRCNRPKSATCNFTPDSVERSSWWRRTSFRWPSAVAGKMCAWRASWSVGTSTS